MKSLRADYRFHYVFPYLQEKDRRSFLKTNKTVLSAFFCRNQDRYFNLKRKDIYKNRPVYNLISKQQRDKLDKSEEGELFSKIHDGRGFDYLNDQAISEFASANVLMAIKDELHQLVAEALKIEFMYTCPSNATVLDKISPVIQRFQALQLKKTDSILLRRLKIETRSILKSDTFLNDRLKYCLVDKPFYFSMYKSRRLFKTWMFQLGQETVFGFPRLSKFKNWNAREALYTKVDEIVEDPQCKSVSDFIERVFLNEAVDEMLENLN